MTKSYYDHDKFVDRHIELALVLNLAIRLLNGAKLDPKMRVIHFYDYANKGKTWLLHELEFMLKSEPHRYEPLLLHLANLIRPSPDEDEFEQQLVYWFSDSLRLDFNGVQSAKNNIYQTIQQKSIHKVVVVMIDDVELLSPDQITKIEGLLTMIKYCDKTLIVAAGRLGTSHWVDIDIRPDRDNTHNLPSFDLNTTSEQIRAQFPNVLRADMIYEVSGGNPGYNYSIAEMVKPKASEPLNKQKAIKTCTKDLRDTLPSDIYQALTALCVLERFIDEDEIAPLLNIFFGHDWSPYACHELREKIFQTFTNAGVLVQWDGFGWTIDKEIRRLVERELQLTDEAMWRSLHCEAYRMFTERAKAAPSSFNNSARDYHYQILKANNFTPEACFNPAEEETLL